MKDNDHVEKQKLHYKNGTNSMCLTCKKYNDDCFEALKQCEKSKNSNYSTVVKCNYYKKKES